MNLKFSTLVACVYAALCQTSAEAQGPAEQPLAACTTEEGPDSVRHYHKRSADPVRWAWWSDAQHALTGSIEERVGQHGLQWHLLFRDMQHHIQAEGVQPLATDALPLDVATLHIIDPSGVPLLFVQGMSIEHQPLRFRLSNKDHVSIGDAWINAETGEIQFTSTTDLQTSFAMMTRDARHPDHWELAIFDDSLVPAAAWPIVVEFFANERFRE